MSRFRWSSLFPPSWQREYGNEFDATIEASDIGPRDMADIIWSAIGLRIRGLSEALPLFLAWIGIAYLNLFAREVQWAASALLVSGALTAFIRPRKWMLQTLILFLSIPISSLYFYQISGVHHEPLYKTVVAMIPTLMGSLVGLALSFSRRARGVA